MSRGCGHGKDSHSAEETNISSVSNTKHVRVLTIYYNEDFSPMISNGLMRIEDTLPIKIIPPSFLPAFSLPSSLSLSFFLS